MIRKSFLVAIAASVLSATGLGQSDNSASLNQHAIPQSERQALVALYGATDGHHWKDHEGWLGPPGTECDWHGVSCTTIGDVGTVVTGIQLTENNVKGRIPAEMAELSHLEDLDIVGNRLTGIVPEPLVRRWLSGSLWIAAEDPRLTDVSEIDFESAASSALCARFRIVIRSNRRVTHFAEICRHSTPRDRAIFCEVKHGEVWPGEFAKLAWLLKDNGFNELQPRYDSGITDATFESTRAVTDHEKKEVVNYADAGLFNLWMMQRAIMGMTEDTEWQSTKRRPRAPDGTMVKSKNQPERSEMK